MKLSQVGKSFGKLLSGLQYLFCGERAGTPKRARTLSQRRDDYVGKLEGIAAAEERENLVLKESLEFERRVAVVRGRIRRAKSHRGKLWTLLGEYGIKRPRLLRWAVIGGGAILLLLLVFSC